MKIDNCISSYYVSERRQQMGTVSPIEETGTNARPRLAPTIATKVPYEFFPRPRH